jgi:hypothetical protein
LFSLLTTIYQFLRIFFDIQEIKKKTDFKKSHFFPNQERNVEKFFLINFGIYVGFKKKVTLIFYYIKFSKNKNFRSINRKIDFLKIFRNANPNITKIIQNMYFYIYDPIFWTKY